MLVLKTLLILLSVGSGGTLSSANQPLFSNQDDRRQLAESAVAEANQLAAKGDVDSLKKALKKYEQALALWRALNDRQAEASTMNHIGEVYYYLEERQKALETFQQELRLWRAIGDHPKEVAEALNNMGVVYSALGLPQKCIESYQEALVLRRAAGDRAGIANTLDNIGLALLDAGELQKALDYISEALAIFRELNFSVGIANELNNLGGVYLTWGDYRKSLELFGQAVEMRHALGQRREEAMGLSNIGYVYDRLGEAQKALDYHNQALELRRALGGPLGEAVSLNNIGIVYDWLGEKEKAIEYYQQALTIFRANNDRNAEASALNNISSFYIHTLGDFHKALEYEQQALEIRRALGQRIPEATELDNIGHIYNRLGDPRKALEYHRQALDTRHNLGDRPGEAGSLTNMGAAHFALGEYKPALDYFNQALPLHRAMGSRDKEAVTLFGIARVESAQGNLNEARVRMEESLNVIESVRGSAASQDLRASFLAKNQEYYEFYLDLLMRLHQAQPQKGYDSAALQASERARARSLLELLAEARIDVDQGIAAELKQRERAAHARISWAQSRLIQAYSQAKPDQSKISTLEDELKKADAARELLNVEIRQKQPRYAELRYPAPSGLKVIQSLLDDQTLLLEYALGKDASFLFAVTANDLLVARLPASSSIATQVEALRAIITSRPQRGTLGNQINYSRELYRELVEPAGKLVTGKQKLIIVPSGILHYLPFEVLLSSGNEKTLSVIAQGKWPYLVRDYAISYVPSAGVLASLRSRPEEKTARRKTFLGFADPDYGSETLSQSSAVRSGLRSAFGNDRSWTLTRLLGSRREVEQIAGLYDRDQVSVLLGDQAREENVKANGELNRYRFVHFATHGLLNEAKPQYSGLILSLPRSASQSTIRNPQSEDGLLQVYEVFNLKLNADLVVLSGCETGLGKKVEGEGLIGLTHAFLYAGTKSVLVSLWNVQDRSTADLMVNLYRQFDRAPGKTEALRQAKLKMIETSRYPHPYYWAPFILIGEPR